MAPIPFKSIGIIAVQSSSTGTLSSGMTVTSFTTYDLTSAQDHVLMPPTPQQRLSVWDTWFFTLAGGAMVTGVIGGLVLCVLPVSFFLETTPQGAVISTSHAIVPLIVLLVFSFWYGYYASFSSVNRKLIYRQDHQDRGTNPHTFRLVCVKESERNAFCRKLIPTSPSRSR